MKKLLAVITVLFLMASCNQTKIAYVDVDEILKEYEGSKTAEAEMKAESDKIGAELNQLYMDFQQRAQEFQSKMAGYSAKVRQEKEQALRAEQQQLQQRQQMAQQQMQVEAQQKMDQINEEIESFLLEYAEKQGYTYILGNSEQTKNIMYAKEDLDITDAVIDALNVGYTGNEDTQAPVETEQTQDTVEAK